METALYDPLRLQALRDTGLMDAPPEPAFDALARSANRLAGTPTALVSLLDADRQFFLSADGLGEPYRSARETPLSHSFCRHVIASGEPLVVDDARAHPLVCQSPVIDEMGVLAYLGVPVLAPGGHVLGTLCVVQPDVRDWRPDELDALRDLAQAASAAIAARLAERTAARDARGARASLSEREAWLALAVEAAGSGLWSADLRTDATFWDARMRELYGVGPDERASIPLALSRIHPDDRAVAADAFTAALADPAGRYSAEARTAGRDGQDRWILSVGQILRGPDGTPDRILGLATDVTERHHAERALRRRSDELEAEVAARTAALERRSDQARQLAAALTRAEQRERRHLAEVLHEDLQQILFGAALHVETDRHRAPAALGRIGRLVGQALDLTRSLAHSLAAPGTADGRLDHALDWLAGLAGSAYGLEVHTELDGDLQVSADVCDAVVHLVRELLFNVVKHAGVTTATLRATGRADRVVVRVADEGVGFDTDRQRRRSHSGMGLRGVRERVRLLGGSCTVRTADGGGTVVTLRVPREGSV